MHKTKKQLTILSLPFKSILNERPKAGQFVLIAFDMRGYCGYESVYWDKEDDHCQYCVAWLPIGTGHVFTKHCAIEKGRKFPILDWSFHFAHNISGYYISKDKLKKEAICL